MLPAVYVSAVLGVLVAFLSMPLIAKDRFPNELERCGNAQARGSIYLAGVWLSDGGSVLEWIGVGTATSALRITTAAGPGAGLSGAILLGFGQQSRGPFACRLLFAGSDQDRSHWVDMRSY